MNALEGMPNAIIIPSGSDVDKAVSDHCSKMFGPNNDDYFIHGSQKIEVKSRKQAYQVVLIEDSKGGMHQLWFKLP